MAESPAEGPCTKELNAAAQLRVAGAWSGQIEALLDVWTIADLRSHLSVVSGFALETINLICAGKVLKDQAPGTLRDVGITVKSKILVTRLAAHQQPTTFLAEEERQARLTRIKAAADAIVNRSDDDAYSDDHYDLQLENQSGETLKFSSESDKRALMLGLMLHAKGRDILLQDNYGEALQVLSMSEEAFELCDQKLLEAVDNVALLQIDIVWCYFMLKDMARIADAGKRLSQAREGLRRSHGPHLERLHTLQGGFCPELAIHVRLELLEGIVAFHTGLFDAAKRSMVSAQSKYNQLQVSDESLALLVSMGYGTKESKRALRVSGQDVNSAIEFVMEERKKKSIRKEEDRRLEKRRRELKDFGKTQSGKVVDSSKLDKLVTIGYEMLLAAEALRQNENDFNVALDVLSDPSKNATLQSKLLLGREQSHKRLNNESIEELLAMGFTRDQVDQILQTAFSVDDAITLLLRGDGDTEAMANGFAQDSFPIEVAESSSNVLTSGGIQTALEESEGQRDFEMEEDIATKLTGDPLAEYDIDVHKEGEAILAYLELLNSKSTPC
ncbi:hypothetical protein GOP47_0012707 [Adiantum capillus-veneris]|uniref:NEDD8 ultimate buster 1 n=1 Tax=Adiantum capillus-veneris TaxID=13818 RepID=A0A9D4URT7_ADICA|nr:hypothetical protein GOP47_0012707 [Adiantum capillus-veneris]